MDKDKKIVPSSTKAVSQILKLAKKALETPNYWDTEEIKIATQFAKDCPEVDRICIFKPNWSKGNSLAVGLFHREEIVHSYAKKGGIIEIINTKSR